MIVKTAIKFEHVKKSFAGNLVVDDLNLNIAKGELFVLVGNSGSGKTTSIKMINRLEDPNSGQVLINGRPTTDYNVRNLRWDIGYVLQQIALFPNMTVAKNIELIPEIKGENKGKGKKMQNMVEELLQEVGLDPKAYFNRYPRELSGGEQQRIGILRAIASKPPIILMDEPFSALDPLSRTNLQDLVITLHQKLHNTIIFVTHDMSEALKVADRIGIMQNGRLIQADKPQEFLHHPENKFVKNFFRGSIGNNLFEMSLRQAVLLNQLKKDLEHTDSIPVIKENVKFAQVLKLLNKVELIQVQDNGNRILGYIDRQWVIQYLNKINDFN